MQIRKSVLIFVVLMILGFSVLYGNQVTSQLEQKLQQSDSEELIPINIIMKQQYDHQDLIDQSTDFPKSERRDFVVQELKSFSDIHQQDILYDLGNLSYNNIVKDIAPLWVSNVISCKATSEVIYDLVQRGDIDIIDYDEMRNMLMYERGNTTQPTGREITWNVTKVNADDVWDLGYTGDGVVVAVIDTGVNYNHVDLADHLWTDTDYPYHGWDFFNNDNNPMDDNGHGTHCSGTVAGNGTAGSQTGMAPDAQIMCLKVMDSNGGGTESGVWNAIQFAIEHGADILSMSFGWLHLYNPSRATWRNTMISVLAADIIASVAAGNFGQYQYYFYPVPDNVATPGDCPPPWLHPDQTLTGGVSSVVCVGATDSNDNIASFSSVGPVTWEDISSFSDYSYDPEMGLIRPDVVAPGVSIKSLDYSNINGYESGWNGTSMATPCVAGVIALMLSKNRELTPAEIDQILEETAVELSTSKSNTYGSGRVDALTAVNQVSLPIPEMSLFPDSLDFGTVQIGSDKTLNFYIENTGTGLLSGTIVPPEGYTVALLGGGKGTGRDTLMYEVSSNAFNIYNITFSPALVQSYNGQMVVTQDTSDIFYLDVYGEGYPTSNDPDVQVNQIIEHFPNPVKTSLTIRYSLDYQNGNVPIGIYNIRGEFVAEINGSDGIAHLDVGCLEDGVYFYKIYSNKNPSFGKFIILK